MLVYVKQSLHKFYHTLTTTISYFLYANILPTYGKQMQNAEQVDTLDLLPSTETTY